MGCQAFLTRCCSTAPMADVEESVTGASGLNVLRCAIRVTRDKLALCNSGVQMVGWELLTLGPERMSCSGA